MVAGCAKVPPNKSRYEADVTPEMEQSFQQAEAAYAHKNYDAALPLFTGYIASYPYNRLTDQALLRQGQIYLRRGQPTEAVEPLRKAAQGVFDAVVTPEALYDLMVAYDRMDQPAEAWNVLRAVPWSATRAKQRLLVASLGVKVGKAGGESAEALAPLYLEVVDAYVILQTAPDPAPTWLLHRSEAEDWIHRWVESSGADLSALKKMSERFSGKTSGGFVLYKLAKTAYEAGDTDEARSAYERYIRGYPKQEYVDTARIRLAELGRKASSDYVAIGVVLPLSGRYGGYGKAVLRGIECGAGILEPCKSDMPIRLVIRDSEGDPAQAKAAFDDLMMADYITAVIGPLASIEVEPVVAEAEHYKIPTMTLTQKEDVAKQSPYVFRNFLTVSDQVRALVDHLCTTDIKEAAILYPQTNVGRLHRELFEAYFAECGGTIKAAEAYDPRTGNYQDAIRALKFDVSEHKLGEGVGFPALFIPDSYRNLSQILPMLSFLNVDHVTLLGTAGWNNPKLLEEFPEEMKGAIFVGSFFAESQAGPTQRFTETYRATYGHSPSFLEAYGFDSIDLLKQAIKESGAQDRDAVRDTLSRIQKFPGATGAINMDSAGNAEHRLVVLTVQDGQIVETHSTYGGL